MNYIKQLDSIRTIAVFLVIICHWVPANHLLDDGRLGTLGAIGVDVFFVLSGFLISGILLQGKTQAEESNISNKTILKNFYIRRALRIFPVFYLLIFILFILRFFFHNINLTELAFGATYTINFYFHKMRYWSGYTTHLWSLAVEEQFYLIWPLLLLFVKRKYIPHAIAVFILIGAVSQMFEEVEFGYLATYTCFDAFGFGALLAYLLQKRKELLPAFYKYLTALAIIGAIVIVAEFCLQKTYHLPQRTLHAICALWLLTYVVKHRSAAKQPLLFRLLNSRLLISLGKISYGIYLYHLYVPYVRDYVLTKLFGNYALSSDHKINFILFFVIDLLLVVAFARVSWVLIEQPLLKFKKYFDNRKQVESPAAALSAEV